MEILIGIALIAALFYLIIPGIGAFLVRSKWRGFRRNIIAGSLLPIAEYEEVSRKPSGLIGHFRFLGSLEAIQGDDTVWVRSGNLSVSAELANTYVYLLPSLSYTEQEGAYERNEEALPDEMPRRVSWNRIFSLPEGTHMFLSGSLFSERGGCVFRSDNRYPLTVVIYDGEPDTILRRSIWAGRQRNEYWNQFTPASLIAGSVALLVVGYNLIRTALAHPQALIALCLSMSPILPFLPPGVLLFFLYRSLWRRGRFFRAERDLIRLPLRYFGEVTPASQEGIALPSGERYSFSVYNDRAEAFYAMEGGKLRTVSLLSDTRSIREWYVFGSRESRDGSAVFAKSSDPMVELLLIPGNPAELSARCVRRARVREVLAGVTFAVCFLINATALFALLNIWVE